LPGNYDVICALEQFELKEDGPQLLEVPPGILDEFRVTGALSD
jgi:hypothetical protein